MKPCLPIVNTTIFVRYLVYEYAQENVKQSTIALSSYFLTKLQTSTHKRIKTANGAEKNVPRDDRLVNAY